MQQARNWKAPNGCIRQHFPPTNQQHVPIITYCGSCYNPALLNKMPGLPTGEARKDALATMTRDAELSQELV